MLLEGRKISFSYAKGDYILNNLDISVKSGEIVGLIARSGYGKSTLAKILAGYQKPEKGQVLLNGKEIPNKGYNPVQLIYQHPEKSINPRWRMVDVLGESGTVNPDLLDKMGIEKNWLKRYSRELSGGELQRFAVTRVLNRRSKFIIADEITTMLDAISQAQIWQIIIDYSKENNIGLVVITHNMHLAKRICNRIIDLEKENEDDR